MHLIVTRPEADAGGIADRLKAMGHHVSLASVMRIAFTGLPLSFSGVQAVIATSRNALRALADGPHLQAAKMLPVFVVGEASAALAHDMGLTRVVAGSRGASDLPALISETCRPDGGTLLYLSGVTVAFDLHGPLTEAGFHVARRVVYESVAAEALPEAVANDIRAGTAEGVVLMSARTARLFRLLAEQAGIGADADRLTYYCLSDEVARAVMARPNERLKVADRPTLEEMLALVGELSSNPLQGQLDPRKQ